jgi:16S rRNA processing protein RimM
MPDRWLRAGRVGRPHGLDGRSQLLELGATLVIGSEERRIIRRAGDDRRPIIAVEGCQDRAGAQALGGEELRVAREGAPVLETDEWWAEDLEGCRVRDGDVMVGTVARLTALPSVDVLEVARSDGGTDLLVPLVVDAVRAVDVDRKEIEVDLRFLGER